MLLLNNWRARTGFMTLLLVIGGFLFLPIVWMLLTSIKPEGEVFVRIPTILPHVPTLENYRALFSQARPRCNFATA
jgi:multiple sugar transport system permease protein